MSKKFTLPEPSEAAILDAIRRGLRIHPKVAWFERMNSGAHVAGEGPTKRFIRFGFVGCPDIIGQLVDGRFLGIEVKRPSGRVSPHQAAFIQRAVEHGGVAFVARSVADVFDVLDRCC